MLDYRLFGVIRVMKDLCREAVILSRENQSSREWR